MKRICAAIVLVILFTSCVTNHYSTTDYPKKPLPKPAAYIAGIVPGLPQLLNGEYIEAALYFGFAGLGLLMYQFPQGLSGGPEKSDTYPYQSLTEDEKKQKLKDISNTGLLIAGMVTAYSYTDGVFSTNKRYKEWKSIDHDNYMALQRQSDDEKELAEEKRQLEETNKQKELVRLQQETSLREKKNELSIAGYPVCFSINEIQKNEHNALLSLSLMSISDKPIQFILLEMRPVDSRGQWILPSDTSATNVRTIRLSSELLSDEITVYSEVIDWDYEDLSNIEITYLKINYVDGSTYEQNDAHILNETLIIIKGDHP